MGRGLTQNTQAPCIQGELHPRVRAVAGHGGRDSSPRATGSQLGTHEGSWEVWGEQGAGIILRLSLQSHWDLLL